MIFTQGCSLDPKPPALADAMSWFPVHALFPPATLAFSCDQAIVRTAEGSPSLGLMGANPSARQKRLDRLGRQDCLGSVLLRMEALLIETLRPVGGSSALFPSSFGLL